MKQFREKEKHTRSIYLMRLIEFAIMKEVDHQWRKKQMEFCPQHFY